MFTVVGLGNPGKEYIHTRHNVGFMVLDEIIVRNNLPMRVASSKYSADISEGILHDTSVGILFPTTFMNNSGISVNKYLKEKGSIDELIVVHDDIDLPFGDIRISYDRGAGGHNGLKSIIDTISTSKFIRVRIGIAEKGFFGTVKRPKGDDLARYVLQEFRKKEIEVFPHSISRIDEALKLILGKGHQYAMQEINGST